MENDGLNMGDDDYPYGDNAPAMEDPVLDFEGTNVFRLVVTATDSDDAKRKARADVTIRLTDLNERPYFDKASRDEVAGPNRICRVPGQPGGPVGGDGARRRQSPLGGRRDRRRGL